MPLPRLSSLSWLGSSTSEVVNFHRVYFQTPISIPCYIERWLLIFIRLIWEFHSVYRSNFPIKLSCNNSFPAIHLESEHSPIFPFPTFPLSLVNLIAPSAIFVRLVRWKLSISWAWEISTSAAKKLRLGNRLCLTSHCPDYLTSMFCGLDKVVSSKRLSRNSTDWRRNDYEFI